MMKKGGYSWLVHDKIPWEKERDTRLMYIDKEFRKPLREMKVNGGGNRKVHHRPILMSSDGFE